MTKTANHEVLRNLAPGQQAEVLDEVRADPAAVLRPEDVMAEVRGEFPVIIIFTLGELGFDFSGISHTSFEDAFEYICMRMREEDILPGTYIAKVMWWSGQSHRIAIDYKDPDHTESEP